MAIGKNSLQFGHIAPGITTRVKIWLLGKSQISFININTHKQNGNWQELPASWTHCSRKHLKGENHKLQTQTPTHADPRKQSSKVEIGKTKVQFGHTTSGNTSRLKISPQLKKKDIDFSHFSHLYQIFGAKWQLERTCCNLDTLSTLLGNIWSSHSPPI